MTGIPGVFRDPEKGEEPLLPTDLLEAVATGMQGEAFALTLVAESVPPERVRAMEQEVWALTDDNAPAIPVSTQTSEAVNHSATETSGSNQGSGIESMVFGANGMNESKAYANGRTTTEGETISYERAAPTALDAELRRTAARIRRAARGQKTRGIAGLSPHYRLESCGYVRFEPFALSGQNPWFVERSLS